MHLPFRVDGRKALVTGGASGIGAVCAGKFAAAGATVVVADLDGDAAGCVAESVGDLAVWLCGPGMSFANGSSFVLDGGWTAR